MVSVIGIVITALGIHSVFSTSARRVPLTTTTIMFVGSVCKESGRHCGEPTKMMVLVVDREPLNIPR